MADENKHAEDEAYMIRLIQEELRAMPFSRSMCTRFPPEPNGYLHIGSAYAIHTSFNVAERFGGTFHLRFDDTNPLKEDIEYVEAIIEDLKWLGYDPGPHIYYGSDYSEEIYQAALKLIRKGKAYVCDLTPKKVTNFRGTLTEPGKDSPYRNRSVQDNLELFEGMKDGRFPAASKVLRAQIDMASPNMNLRDPILYRIIDAEHYRTGTAWRIYPMYDFAHPIQDAIEGITYSLCSIEFKDHRPLYEWVLDELDIPEPPRQREFGRLNLTGVLTSKRFLRPMIEGGHVDGWDDPRLPTLQGLRRRGFTPASIRAFIEAVGSIRTQSTVDISLLDHCLRQDLKEQTDCFMAVLRPLKVVITNYPDEATELLAVENNRENEERGARKFPFSKTIFIEQDDFMEVPVKGFHRLTLNGEVRLKGAYFISCHEVVKDPLTGEPIELRCTYDSATKSGSGFNARKVKGTIHWVSAAHAVPAEIRLYEKLLHKEEMPETDESWIELLNPHSLTTILGALLEPSLQHTAPEQKVQFLRHGYFCADIKDHRADRLVFNRVVPLKGLKEY
ncbi:glutamine--tRNA ligase/YqeY domain fusion protein [Paenibacillus pasadenensis]|uniref:glutamine--tRNA ligase/YqeY domain fusion protein n=1 Tax=Paenibacillus pasadenensis TaxID=217090 RepID=UPI0020403FAF|nr:glutamine--tRNA ligase/YqeY domain fusion protein [Paenibacillus pasadenensis]MCM3748773.1 glutamine--tRNA ligase/YqeY domain fusion protein [Paenibacillus pasadenensis]